MKKILFTTLLIAGIANTFGQVGINTENPHTTLHIKENIASNFPDGLIIPNFTASELGARNSAYGTDQNATLVFITAGTGVSGTKTENIAGKGFYYYDATITRWVAMSKGSVDTEYGELKRGFQSADHDGWIKLDGRNLTLLSTAQRANATLLGLSGSLPNLANLVLVQNSGQALGAVFGDANDRKLTRNQLPNFTLSGSTSTNGAHTHSVNTSNNIHLYNGHNRQGATRHHRATKTTNSAGNHSHTVSISLNGGVTQTTYNVLPQTLNTNVFIYLGN